MEKGNINVSVENIFPLIKKFLYSDHEIFLRELISNATDATVKLRHLTNVGEAKVEYGNPIIEVKIDKKKKTIHIIDQGIGMTSDEIQKYINEVAFSSAEEFLEKYKDDEKDTGIIGHFGLGFYSAFMVAKKVEIITKSYKDEPAVLWECDGSPNYTLHETEKKDWGTEVILHVADDSKEFLENKRLQEILVKYNKFMPIPIKLGTKTETKTTGEGDAAREEKIEIDNIINNPSPAWTKQPKNLKDTDYLSFYKELYPMQFEDPLFNIHLNVDYPFHLTGILYFPKLSNDISVQKDKIQLYQNQVFVTDNVEGIVPEFLTLLRGVIDSPDIPLNVSRSYLQTDGNVKKISNYITKKVADKILSIFKKDRKSFEEKWNNIKVVIEFGMLSDEKFFEKAEKFALYPTVDDTFLTFEELENTIKPNQTNKDDKIIVLYTNDKDKQHSYIEEAQAKGYVVILLDSPVIMHLIQKIESTKKNLSFTRVDADHIDNLIDKKQQISSKLSDTEKETLKTRMEEIIPKEQYTIQLESMDGDLPPFKLTQPEFMRRMKDMQASGGGMFGLGNMPDMYSLVVNINHTLISEIISIKEPDKQKELIIQGMDLAKLSQGLLQGKELTKFIKRSFQLLNKE